MKLPIAAVLVLVVVPAHAGDRYSGFYSHPCGHALQCDLRISPAGRDRWRIAFAAADPRDPDVRPVCAFETKAAIGEAQAADMTVSDIAVGRVKGRAFGLFDLGDGRVSWSSTWQACPGIRAADVYGAVGD